MHALIQTCLHVVCGRGQMHRNQIVHESMVAEAAGRSWFASLLVFASRGFLAASALLFFVLFFSCMVALSDHCIYESRATISVSRYTPCDCLRKIFMHTRTRRTRKPSMHTRTHTKPIFDTNTYYTNTCCKGLTAQQGLACADQTGRIETTSNIMMNIFSRNMRQDPQALQDG